MPDSNVGSLVARLVLDITGFSKSIQQAESELKAGLSDISKSADSMDQVAQKTQKAKVTASEFGTAMRDVGAAIAPVSAGILALGVGAVKSAASFEQASNIFQQQSGATAEEMERARQAALQLGQDTVFSATEAMEAMINLAKGGMTADQAIAAAQGTVALAAAADISMAEAADITVRALNQFGMEASEAGKAADILAAAANSSAVDITDIAYALQAVGPVAAQAGLSLQDTATAIAELGNAGLVGSDAGTSLKSMLMALMSPTEKASKLMQELGIHIFDANGKMLPFRTIIGELQTAMSKLTEEQRAQAMATLFGSDAIRAANILIKDGVKGWDDMSAAVGRAGAAQETADARMKGLSGAIEQLKGSIETLLTQQGSPLLGFLTNLVNGISNAIQKFGELPGWLQQAIAAFALIIGFGGPMLMFFGNLIVAITNVSTAIGTLIQGFRMLQTALNLANLVSLITSPIGIIIAAVAGLAAAAYLVISNWSSIKQFFSDLWTGVTQTFQTFWSWLQGFFAQWGPTILAILMPFIGIPLLIIQHWQDIQNFLGQVWDGIQSTASSVWDAITGTIKSIWDGFVRWIKNAAKSMADGVVAAFEWLYNHNYHFQDLVDFISQAWDWLKNVTSQVWEAIKSALNTVWEWMKNTATTTWQTLQTWISNAWQTISNITNSIWNAIRGFLTSLWQGLVSLATSVWNSIKNAIMTPIQAAQAALSSAWSSIMSAASSAWNSILGAIRSIASSIASTLSSLASQAYSWGANLISGFVSGITSMIGRVADAARSVAQAAQSFLGFHSPAKEGPGAEADQWAPNLMRMFAEGIEAGIPRVRSALAAAIPSLDMVAVSPATAAAISPVAGSSSGTAAQGGSGGGGTYVQNAPLMVVQHMEVRNDQDVMKMSQELQNLNRHTLRALGVSR